MSASHLVRLLVLSDPDIETVTKLSEKYVRHRPQFDAVIVTGPFIHKKCDTLEDKAIAQSDISAIIAQLENIVCRVLYLSADTDPVKTLTEQLHLTPNSVNIHARKMALSNDLYLAGFTETSENLITTLIDDVDQDDEKPPTTNKSSTQVIIEEILLSEFTSCMNFDSKILPILKNSTSLDVVESVQQKKPKFGIFVFNFKFAHSLSSFLFHMTHVIDEAGVKLCIVPAVGKNETDATRLPREFGFLTIVAPRSIRIDREYCAVTMNMIDGQWRITSVATRSVDEL